MSHRLITRFSSAAAVVLLMSGVAACTGDDGVESSAPGQPVVILEPFSVRALVAQLPASDVLARHGVDLADGTVITVADLDVASLAAGVERPADDSAEAWQRWGSAVTGGQTGPTKAPVALQRLDLVSPYSPADFRKIAGFSVNDAASMASIDNGAFEFSIVDGLDADVLSADLVRSDDGLRSTRHGPDMDPAEAMKSPPTAVSPQGFPVHFAQKRAQVGFGTSAEIVRAWQRGGASLADDPGFASVADQLDELDTVSATISRSMDGGFAERALGSHGSPASVAQLQDQIEGVMPEQAFDVAALGFSADGEIQAVYHFADEADASRAAKTLESAWTSTTVLNRQLPLEELVSVDRVDVAGPVVSVSLRPKTEQASVVVRDLQLSGDLVFSSRPDLD